MSKKSKTNPRGTSARNTGWNGVEQLIKGIDGKANGKSWKWQGHVDNASDTFTQQGIFNTNLRGLQAVEKMLQDAGANVNRLADDVVAKVAVEGRKEATDIEEQEFRLGKTWVHANKPGAYGPGDRWTSSSRYDPKLGGYVGFSSSGNKLRLINFSFEAGHTYRYNGIHPGVSRARFTSQLANLFENEATWRKSSPFWMSSSGGKAWGHYKAGASRDGRHYFSRVVDAVDRGFLRALPKAQANFDKWMANPNSRRVV